jgi:hypothetical protein
MSFSSKSFIAAAAGAAALSLAAGAFAQDRPPPGGPDGAAGARAFGDHMKERFEARQAERIKALHDVLSIRTDQESAFQAFTSALHPAHDGKGPHGPGQDAQGGPPAMPATTPERLDRLVARQQEHQQRIEARVTAIKTFYALLSPEQRHTFDSLVLLRDGEGRGHDEGPGGHGGWGPRA